jgi:glutamate-1-semialdehyde 2,1-aminomutase
MGRRRDELMQRAASLPALRARAARLPIALKAQGVRLYDVDNIGYTDYLGAGGAAIVGHASQFVLDAVRKVLLNGVPEGLHVPLEVELAETLKHFLPWVGQWWFCRNQDEALHHVLRWVRASTGREGILVLDGGACPGSILSEEGSPQDLHAGVRVVPGWDLDRIDAVLTAGASRIAAFVVDPLMTRVGLVAPPPAALPRISEACQRNGVLLVLDERVSGFRVHRGGAAAWAGVTPDLAVYGGALGGGFPLGVAAFRDGIDATVTGDALAPAHIASLAAAEAVLSILKNDSIYERLEGRAAQLVEGMLALAVRFSRPMTINRLGSVFALYMSGGPVVDGASALAADAAAYRRLASALLEEGVLLPQDPCVPAFVSNAHGAKDVDETLAACERVLLRLHQEDLP